MKTNRKYLNVVLLFFILLMQTYSAKDDNLYISEKSTVEGTSTGEQSQNDSVDKIIDELLASFKNSFFIFDFNVYFKSLCFRWF